MVEAKLPSDSTKTRHITRRVKSFTLIDGDLYR
jgi:hypothetical protein